ncbi:ABC transporter permease [Lutibaculum baratangense]|uniref:Spermidine Putrescine ABC transporter permease component PotB n=1 Tax=Lutibaculum baratangense AMV1 TaxID=631454 RepID=V4QUA9_9HYPH|nr:ABC transporter permease [Lutibaculum baratangense]ESR23352.1 Spermidine Putrescine ABC transporter permease component PotB [Lutibaculum baratangense AMV1]
MADIPAAGTVPEMRRDEELTTADGRPLRVALRRSQRQLRRRAFYLVAPLLVFLLVTFGWPIANMIAGSVYNPEVAHFLPLTSSAISDWDGEDVPGEDVFAAMAMDMESGLANRTIGRAAGRINREIPGARSLVMGTARDLEDMQPPYREAFLAEDERWGDLEFWRLIKRETRIVTPAYYLLALDFEYNSRGEIVERPEIYQVYRQLFWRTAWMSLTITALCVLLGYPVAHLLATLPLKTSNVLMILVLLPFWTSLLVRTSAWIVLLQQQGVINDLLVWANIIDASGRIRMIYNQTGTIIAMTHILLPFMILPLYSVMKTIPPSYMRAARSLGATQFTAFTKVYMPLTIPGVAAGVLLVFILAIGYYITPALVGGESGIFISNLIAQNMQGTSAQLKLASALATILLVGVLFFYWLFNKLIGVDRLKFG